MAIINRCVLRCPVDGKPGIPTGGSAAGWQFWRQLIERVRKQTGSRTILYTASD